MKNRIIKLLLLFVVVAGIAESAHAQTRSTTRRRTTTTNATRQKAAATPPPPAQDTVKKVVEAPPPPPELKLDTIRKSLRNDNAIEKNLVKERTPLEYEHIREDDAVYRQRVWRELDIREKVNQGFGYRANEDNGNQRFINILLQAIKSGDVVAFSPIDDRFTTPITFAEVTRSLVGTPKVIQVKDWVNDPDGSKDIMKDTTIIDEFNPDNVMKYQIKEDVVFDKESSRMHTKILGIAPLKDIINESDGTVRASVPLFWVYYPDLRPLLARFEVYNGKNYGARMSWEELFEMRMFSARIIKSTIDNPYDMAIEDYIKDPILRLLEGENMKDRIFNYEQDLWAY